MTASFGMRLRAAFTTNIKLKLFSAAVALILYSLAHGSQDAQRTMSVDLVVVLPPDTASRMLVSPLPPQVRVTLRGSRGTLDELHSDDVGNLQLDAHTGQERRALLDRSMVHVPPGVRVDQIDPPAIDFMWDDLIVRDVPVQVSVVGTPAPGYVVKGAPAATPLALRLRGAKNEVATMQFARAQSFDVSGLTAGVYVHALSVDRPPPRMSLDAATVSVSIEIARELSDRMFTRVAVAVTGQAHARTLPAEVDVHLACSPDIAHALRADQIVPRVSVAPSPGAGSVLLPVIVAVEGCEPKVIPSSVVVKW